MLRREIHNFQFVFLIQRSDETNSIFSSGYGQIWVGLDNIYERLFQTLLLFNYNKHI